MNHDRNSPGQTGAIDPCGDSRRDGAENDARPFGTLVEPWDIGPSRFVARTRVFTLYRRWCSSRTDKSKAGDFVYLRSSDWCNVVALTPDRRVVMVEQFRMGIARVTLELAGGIMDEGEDPVRAGLRELREETGYAGPPQGVKGVIGVVSANPAILNNYVHTVLVEGCVKVHDTQQDGNEEIRTRLVPLADIPALVRGGVIHHTLVVSALMHFQCMG